MSYTMIHGKNHFKVTQEVFQRLQEDQLTIHLAKSDFCLAEVKYLGHVVGHCKVIPIRAKTLVILKYSVPGNVRSLSRFLGMANYYRRYCANLAEITTPLTNLLRKYNKFVWSQDCDKALCEKRRIL